MYLGIPSHRPDCEQNYCLIYVSLSMKMKCLLIIFKVGFDHYDFFCSSYILTIPGDTVLEGLSMFSSLKD